MVRKNLEIQCHPICNCLYDVVRQKTTHQLGELNTLTNDCPFKELWGMNLLMMDMFNKKEPTNVTTRGPWRRSRDAGMSKSHLWYQLGELNTLTKVCPFKKLWRMNLHMMDIFKKKGPFRGSHPVVIVFIEHQHSRQIWCVMTHSQVWHDSLSRRSAGEVHGPGYPAPLRPDI